MEMFITAILCAAIYHINARQHGVTISVTPYQEPDIKQYQTLSELIQANKSQRIWNTSNTTLEFLHGTHEINVTHKNRLVISNISNMVWQGILLENKRPIIHCEHEFVFLFQNVVNMTLKDLTVRNCGYDIGLTFPETLYAALALVNVSDTTFHNILITESTGYGLLAINMMGKSEIISCELANNKGMESLTSGGNMIVIFNRQNYAQQKLTEIMVLNTFVHGGNNGFNCNGKHNQYIANGLVVALARQNLAVTIFLQNITFSRNTQNMCPSILVNIISPSNKIIFMNCSFIHEGTLRLIYRQGSVAQYSNHTEPLVIEHSLFRGGVGSGVEICNESGDSNVHVWQDIIVRGCIFEGFISGNPATNALIKYQQIEVLSSCPKVRLKLVKLIYQHNTIPSSKIELSTELPYNQHIACPSVFIDNCVYRDNHLSDDYIAWFGRSKQSFHNSIWRHEKYFRHHVNNLDQVVVQNTTFIDNKNGQNSFKAIVGGNKVFVSFKNCKFIDSYGTALQVNQSVVSLLSENSFINNLGKEGGALSLIQSRLHLHNNSNTVIKDNKAGYGGGIFATPFTIKNKVLEPILYGPWYYCKLCTFSLRDYDYNGLNTMVSLINNRAVHNGDAIFNGVFNECCVWIEGCETEFCYLNHNKTLFNDRLFSIAPNTYTDISSVPSGLISQEAHLLINSYPGANFDIPLRLIGESELLPFAIVSGRLCYEYNPASSNNCNHNYLSEVHSGVDQQVINHNYSNVTYSIFSPENVVYLKIQLERLYFETPSISLGEQMYFIAEIYLQECPIGFQVARKINQKPFCECIQYLQRLGIQCDINRGGKVLHEDRMWIGFHHAQPNNVTIHKSCPFDYCISEDKYISLSNTNEQCNHRHAGVLCGQCDKNLSIVLGSSNCKQCSNTYLLLLIPFALAGVALVALLLKCNLTVATGHINGIIFYANIVHINKPLLFSTQNTTAVVFSTFIAWLNLDFGIETCFFENMDVYAKVWLQFVFPVYVWFMIFCIVYLAHYSSRAGRLIGNNSVPVLATLFLLSYAKLLRNIINVFSFTFLEFEDGSYVTVWLLDGNIGYFDSKHTALAITALLFLLIYIVPLTVLVLLAPLLQAASHHKGCGWVNRLKPFLDAYQGPYSKRFRSWTGVMLVVRIILLTIFSSNYDIDLPMTFFWIIFTVGPIAMMFLFKHNIYKHKFPNLIEALSLINLVSLCAINWLTTSTTYKEWHVIRDYSTYISLFMAFLTFLAILVYPKLGPKCCRRAQTETEILDVRPIADNKENVQIPTFSVVELSDSTDSLQELLISSHDN